MRCLRLVLPLVAAALALPGQALANWGENWGSMLWGSAGTAVPTLDWIGLALLGSLLVVTAGWFLRRRVGWVSGLLVVLAIPAVVIASSIDDINLHVFTDGTPAVAGEVNANFDTVQAAVNDNDSRIGTALSDAAAAQNAADTAAGAVTSEATVRSSADTAHDNAISTNVNAVSNEGISRTAADAAHDTAISGNTAAISTNAADISSIEGAALTRFEACADAQTIADHQTGLLWERKVGSLGSGEVLGGRQDVNETYSWCDPNPTGAPSCTDSVDNPPTGSAFTNFIADLNNPNSGTASTSTALTGCFAGICDWRLPSIGELTTLLDATCAGGAPCILPGFVDAEGITGAGGATALSYWSASAHSDAQNSAWIVDFNIGAPGGGAYSVAKSGVRAARAVRRGSCMRDVGARITYQGPGCSISCGPNSAPLGGSCVVPSTCSVTCPKNWVAECNCFGPIFCAPAQCSCIPPGPSLP